MIAQRQHAHIGGRQIRGSQMKMVMAVVPRDEAEGVLNSLITAGQTATFTESRGGMLRQAQYTLFIGVDASALDQVLDIIRESCHSSVQVANGGEAGYPATAFPSPASASVGGAVVFVWDLEQFAIF